jgi:hypothetical protein
MLRGLSDKVAKSNEISAPFGRGISRVVHMTDPQLKREIGPGVADRVAHNLPGFVILFTQFERHSRIGRSLQPSTSLRSLAPRHEVDRCRIPLG